MSSSFSTAASSSHSRRAIHPPRRRRLLLPRRSITSDDHPGHTVFMFTCPIDLQCVGEKAPAPTPFSRDGAVAPRGRPHDSHDGIQNTCGSALPSPARSGGSFPEDPAATSRSPPLSERYGGSPPLSEDRRQVRWARSKGTGHLRTVAAAPSLRHPGCILLGMISPPPPDRLLPLRRMVCDLYRLPPLFL